MQAASHARLAFSHAPKSFKTVLPELDPSASVLSIEDCAKIG
jgi:hypothetical protein